MSQLPAAAEMMKGATIALNAEGLGELSEVNDVGDLLRRLQESRKNSLFDFVSGGPADPFEEPEAPRHCLEDMELVAPIE